MVLSLLTMERGTISNSDEANPAELSVTSFSSWKMQIVMNLISKQSLVRAVFAETGRFDVKKRF